MTIRQKQKQILGFILNMKLLIREFGLEKIKFFFRSFPAMVHGSGITPKSLSEVNFSDDDIFWSLLDKINLDYNSGFEFDGGYYFKCDFDIGWFILLKKLKEKESPISKILEILKQQVPEKDQDEEPLGGTIGYNPYELFSKFHNLTPNWREPVKLWVKNQKEYIRRRLRAIRMLWDGSSRQEVINKLNIDPSTLIVWIKTLVCYGVDEGLMRLAKEKEINRSGKLNKNQEYVLIYMIENQSPTDYGYHQHIFTAKILTEIFITFWGIKISDQTIYNILRRNNYSYQKAHRDYEHADPEQQAEYAENLFKVIKNTSLKERIVFFDEFSLTNRVTLFYGWARKNTRLLPASNEKNRKRLNGFLSVDAKSGELYLEFSKKSKIKDIVNYMYNLVLDSKNKGYSSIIIVLRHASVARNHSTHKGKMRAQLSTIMRLNPELNGFKVKFMYTPPYSPDFNLAEYLIHQLRLKALHHQPTNVSLNEMIQAIKSYISKEPLQTQRQIKNTINHILKLGGISDESFALI